MEVNKLLKALFFFQAEDGIRDFHVTGVQTCALPIFGFKRSANRAASSVVIGRSAGTPTDSLDLSEPDWTSWAWVSPESSSCPPKQDVSKQKLSRSDAKVGGKLCHWDLRSREIE